MLRAVARSDGRSTVCLPYANRNALLANGGSSQLTVRYTRTHLYPITI